MATTASVRSRQPYNGHVQELATANGNYRVKYIELNDKIFIRHTKKQKSPKQGATYFRRDEDKRTKECDIVTLGHKPSEAKEKTVLLKVLKL